MNGYLPFYCIYFKHVWLAHDANRYRIWILYIYIWKCVSYNYMSYGNLVVISVLVQTSLGACALWAFPKASLMFTPTDTTPTPMATASTMDTSSQAYPMVTATEAMAALEGMTVALVEIMATEGDKPTSTSVSLFLLTIPIVPLEFILFS